MNGQNNNNKQYILPLTQNHPQHLSSSLHQTVHTEMMHSYHTQSQLKGLGVMRFRVNHKLKVTLYKLLSYDALPVWLVVTEHWTEPTNPALHPHPGLAESVYMNNMYMQRININ